jgi:ABC-type Na+ efflux pump permease subunit
MLRGVLTMYRNAVYLDEKIVDLDEYKKSPLHQKRQQDPTFKKFDKKKKNDKGKDKKDNQISKNKKFNESKKQNFNIVIFAVIFVLFCLLSLAIAYFATHNF